MMKKLLILFAAALLAFTSCGTTNPPEESTEETPREESTEEVTVPFPLRPSTSVDPAEYPPKTYTTSLLPGTKPVQGKLAEELGVPEHVEGTYTSPSGISQVVLDAQVVFPDIDHVNIYRAEPRLFSQEEIDYFAKYLGDKKIYFGGSTSWYDVQTHRPWNAGESPYLSQSYDYSGVKIDVYQLWIDNLPVTLDVPLTYDPEEARRNIAEALKEYLSEEEAEKFISKTLFIHYDLEHKTGQLAGDGPTLEFKGKRSGADIMPLAEYQAEDSLLSLDQALEIAEKAVKPILPDYGLCALGQTWLSANVYDPQPRQYFFVYSRSLDGITSNDSLHFGSSSEYGYVSDQESLLVVVGDEGIEYMRYESPFSVGEVLQENVSLLPFSEIQAIYEKMLLLSIQYYEIDNEDLKKNLRNIFEIRFGYMALLKNDGTYQYTPVWDFYGTQRLTGTGGYGMGETIPPSFEDIVLTLNAITGDVIDRSLGY